MENEKFEMIAKTLQGLEGVLAKELERLGAENITELTRGVSFWGDKEMLYRANFFLRTALRVLKPIYTFDAESADEVYEKVKELEWESILTAEKTFAIDATVFSDLFRHSQFLQYRVKDGIADRFMEKYGKRPNVQLTNPDVQINIHVADTRCTISLDSSGESLHKRGYRTTQTDAPISEVLAAGMLLTAGWDGQSDFIDPMCGSGTILIEAAMIAKGIAPGLYRKSFAFQSWEDYDADLFAEIYNDEQYEKEFEHTIYGSDILRTCVVKTEANVKSAGVADVVKLQCIPFQEFTIPEGEAMIMFNPPYGERIGGQELPELYAAIGKKLKEECQGKEVWIITVDNEDTQNIRLAPSVRIPLLNGKLECELRKYEMFAGRRDDYIKAKRERGEDVPEVEREDRYDRGERRERGDRRDREDRGERRDRRFGDRDGEDIKPSRRYVDAEGVDARESDRYAYLQRRHEEREEELRAKERRERRREREEMDERRFDDRRGERRDDRRRDERGGERRFDDRRGERRDDRRRGERGGERRFDDRRGERRDDRRKDERGDERRFDDRRGERRDDRRREERGGERRFDDRRGERRDDRRRDERRDDRRRDERGGERRFGDRRRDDRRGGRDNDGRSGIERRDRGGRDRGGRDRGGRGDDRRMRSKDDRFKGTSNKYRKSSQSEETDWEAE